MPRPKSHTVTTDVDLEPNPSLSIHHRFQTPVLSISIVFHSVKWNRLRNITGELLFFPYCINLLMLLQIS